MGPGPPVMSLVIPKAGMVPPIITILLLRLLLFRILFLQVLLHIRDGAERRPNHNGAIGGMAGAKVGEGGGGGIMGFAGGGVGGTWDPAV